MRGRLPTGPEYFDQRLGSGEAKERAKAIFATLYGDGRRLQVCAQLGIHGTRFHQLRERAVDAVLAALEPRPAGRPSRTARCDAEYVRALEQRIAALELALDEAQVREEIALILPQVRTAGADEAAAGGGKKRRRRPVKIRKPR